MLEQFEPIIKLNKKEKAEFGNFIKKQRKDLISSPKETAKKAMELHKHKIEKLLATDKVSDIITELRQLSYDQFLVEESYFNTVILSEVAKKFSAPKKILHNMSHKIYSFRNLSEIKFQEKVRHIFGEFAGYLSPYIYDLCLSNTQSRRSRAGKVFEGIIYFLYEYYNFAYDSQTTIGRKVFNNLGLGKVVDSVLPSTKAFTSFRNKTIVGSMKTTLRERWQEVVEEITRSNLPNIYLLTVDEDISILKAKQMAEHNIVLVVLKKTKEQTSLNQMRNIIDFETLFTKEIPSVMDYWENNND